MKPEDHHPDCDYRNSMAAKETAELTGVDVAENSEVYDCNLGCVPTPDHTPGPLHVEFVDEAWEVVTESGTGIASVWDKEADARLIAAAPDLLAACEAFVRLNVCERRGIGVYVDCGECPCCLMLAAITKATSCD